MDEKLLPSPGSPQSLEDTIIHGQFEKNIEFAGDRRKGIRYWLWATTIEQIQWLTQTWNSFCSLWRDKEKNERKEVTVSKDGHPDVAFLFPFIFVAQKPLSTSSWEEKKGKHTAITDLLLECTRKAKWPNGQSQWSEVQHKRDKKYNVFPVWPSVMCRQEGSEGRVPFQKLQHEKLHEEKKLHEDKRVCRQYSRYSHIVINDHSSFTLTAPALFFISLVCVFSPFFHIEQHIQSVQCLVIDEMPLLLPLPLLFPHFDQQSITDVL